MIKKNYLIAILLFVISLIGFKYSRNSVIQIFPENSIGVVYRDTIQNDTVSITIRFPNYNLPENSIQFDPTDYYKTILLDLPGQEIILFDEMGELGKLEKVKDCNYKFWCENDGGVKFEPTYFLKIAKKEFERLPKSVNKSILGKMSCFAIVNPNLLHWSTFNPGGSEKDNMILVGRLSTDYSRYSKELAFEDLVKLYDRNVQVSVSKDLESGITDYCIRLEAYNSRREFEMGCCGP